MPGSESPLAAEIVPPRPRPRKTPSTPRPRGVLHSVRRWFEEFDLNQRAALCGAAAIVVSEFLPWYRNEVPVAGKMRTITQTALESASFVELALLLVAASVITLIVLRGSGRELTLPAHDGTLIAIAGGWSALLVVVRMLVDRPSLRVGDLALTLGLDWGAFVGLAAAVVVCAAGLRMRMRPSRQEIDHPPRAD